MGPKKVNYDTHNLFSAMSKTNFHPNAERSPSLTCFMSVAKTHVASRLWLDIPRPEVCNISLGQKNRLVI